MLVIEAEHAPKKTGSIIAARRGGWVTVLGTTVMMGALNALLWVAPLDSTDPVRDKSYITAGIAGLLVLLFILMWVWPAHVYRKYVSKGYILEIRDKAVIEFARGYWTPVDGFLDGVRAIEQTRYDTTLRELYAMQGNDSLIKARLLKERGRLAALHASPL